MTTEREPAAMATASGGGSARRETPTFLFTDIEGSTRILRALGDDYADALARHRSVLAAAVRDNGGRVFGSEGDALFCAFPTPAGALLAAAAAQRGLASHDWPAGAELTVRMGIHTGEAIATGDNYVGLPLHETARITAAGHGGQVLVSDATRRLVSSLPAGIELRDLGERRFKDLGAPQRVYQLVGEGLRDGFAPLRTLDARANDLPVQLTSFVGRAELDAAKSALAQTRLLSLTGPGGTGKTRLALQLAAAVSDEFRDGVYFVALDSVTDPDLVAAVVAAAVGLVPSGTTAPVDALLEFLRDREVLLVLDNFEQVVDAADTIARLLREAPQTKVVVTTRIVLRVYGERDFPVPPLGMPAVGVTPRTADEAAQYEAVRLFVERALAAQPQFVLTDANASLVVDIVRRLDGLPLAIELAAARTRSLAVPALHARLDQHHTLLTGGARDLPGRQQTLRGAIDWSYDLLEEPDRRLFERFAVHAGGAFLTQADAVCGPPAEIGEDVLDGLTSLTEKSLLKPDVGADEDPRYLMLATIRDYAHEHLEERADLPTLAERHAQVYLELVEELTPQLAGPQGRSIGDRLEQDHDNLRAALDWAIGEGDAGYALRFIAAVWRFWQVRGHLAEARRRVDAVVTMPNIGEQPADVRAKGFGAAGSICYWQADVRETHRLYGLALAAAREAGDDALLAEALYNLGFAPRDQETMNSALYAAGQPYWAEALELYRKLGDARGVADASWGIAMAYQGAGDAAAAIRHGEEALSGYRAVGDPLRIGWGLYLLAGLRVPFGDLELVEGNLRESLETFARANDRAGMLLNLTGFAMLAAHRGQTTRANRIGGAVESLGAATGASLLDAPIELVDFVKPTRPVGDPAAEAAWDAGTSLSAEEATSYALSDADTTA